MTHKLILIFLETLFVVIGSISFFFDKYSYSVFCLLMAIIMILNQIVLEVKNNG